MQAVTVSDGRQPIGRIKKRGKLDGCWPPFHAGVRCQSVDVVIVLSKKIKISEHTAETHALFDCPAFWFLGCAIRPSELRSAWLLPHSCQRHHRTIFVLGSRCSIYDPEGTFYLASAVCSCILSFAFAHTLPLICSHTHIHAGTTPAQMQHVNTHLFPILCGCRSSLRLIRRSCTVFSSRPRSAALVPCSILRHLLSTRLLLPLENHRVETPSSRLVIDSGRTSGDSAHVLPIPYPVQ